MPQTGNTDRPAALAATGPQSERIVRLLRGCSIEVTAELRFKDNPLREQLDPGTAIYINHSPRDTHHRLIAAACDLRRAGFNPVPHVAARYLVSFTQANDYLERLAGEAGVDRILAIAGDAERPVGPFQTSLQLLETGLFEKRGMRRIGFAGYPEGHPRVSTQTLDQALRAKLDLAGRKGLQPYIVTQFGFAGHPIIDWIGRLRAQGIDVPVRIGLAGPASVASLAKFAVRCGVGLSLRALARGHTAVARILVEAGPEPVIHSLAADADQALRIEGLHFFTFGGVARTAAWIRAIKHGHFQMSQGTAGFRVWAEQPIA